MRVLALTALLHASLSGLAHAQQGSACSFHVSSIDFGVVDALQGAVLATSGTVTIDCTDDVRRVCANIGAGSGGADGSWRHLRHGSDPQAGLRFQLYDVSNQVWGSAFVSPPGGNPVQIEVNPSGDATVTIEARLSPSLARPGSYSSTFTDPHFTFGGSGLDCSDPDAQAWGSGSPTFSVLATLEPSCEFQAENIEFGNHGLLQEGIAATGAVAVTCTAQTGYTVSLGPGLAGSADAPDDRRMSFRGDQIRYGLYRDAGHMEPWGDRPDTLLEATGSGTQQVIQVYGRVPPQPTPPPGNYADTVVVTVTIAD
jgi:spore coat protein U-like protein